MFPPPILLSNTRRTISSWRAGFSSFEISRGHTAPFGGDSCCTDEDGIVGGPDGDGFPATGTGTAVEVGSVEVAPGTFAFEEGFPAVLDSDFVLLRLRRVRFASSAQLSTRASASDSVS